MQNHITMPDFMLKAKDSSYLTKSNNKILFAMIECLMFVVVFLMATASTSVPMVYLAGIIARLNKDVMTIREAMDLDFMMPLDLILRFLHIVIALFYCRLLQRRKAYTLGFTKKDIIPQYIGGLIAGLVIFSAGVGITVLTGAATLSKSNTAISIPIYIAYIVGWIVQGMSEEVICRGYFFVSLTRKLSVPASVAISSIAFAAIHIGNAGLTPLAIFNLALFGVFAAVVYMRTGNIWFVGALHSIWNFVQGNLYGIAVSGSFNCPTIFTTIFDSSKTIINGGAFGLEGGLAVTTILVVGTLITIFCPSLRKSAS